MALRLGVEAISSAWGDLTIVLYAHYLVPKPQTPNPKSMSLKYEPASEPLHIHPKP